MDAFEQLLTSPSHGSVNPETLEYIGQKASTEFLEKKASLNAAIVKLASQHPELNNEHIHRIAEFANNTTFQHLFDRNKDKNVHFDIADPGTIIRDLRDGGSPAHSGKVLHNKMDYHRPPISEEKDSDGGGDIQYAIEDLQRREEASGEAGQGEPIQKVASAGLDPEWVGSANPVNDVYAEHLRLVRLRDEFVAAHETADLMYKQAQEDFYRAVKSEVVSADGVGISVAASAVQKLAGNKMAETELQPVIERLLGDGVSSETLTSQMTKTAGKVLNLSHPLAKTAAGLVKTAEERSLARYSLDEVDACINETSSFLKIAGLRK